RNVADKLAVVGGAQIARRRDLADYCVVQLPLAANRRDVFGPGGHAHHPLLALGGHDLPGLELLLTQGHAVELDVHAGAVSGHLGQRRSEAGGTAVLKRLDEPLLHELLARLDQLLAGEGIADLDARPLVCVLLAELLAGQNARSADPVPPGRRAVEEDRTAPRRRPRPQNAFARKEPDAHRLDEAVAGIGLVEKG